MDTDPHFAGYRARILDTPIADCPYESPPDADAWRDGFQLASADLWEALLIRVDRAEAAERARKAADDAREA